MRIFFLLSVVFMSSLFTETFASENVQAVSRSSKKPLVIVLLGPPGAGKGTHAKPLSTHLSLPHISTGDLFRENLAKKTPLGEKVATFLEKGSLVPDELVVQMLFDRLQKTDCFEGYVLDGFPRSISQAKALDKYLGGEASLLVIHFDVSDQVITERILGRLVCKKCGSMFHKMFSPPKKEGVCDECTSSLSTRSDDNAKTIKTRLSNYHKEIAPILRYYKDRKVLRHVEAEKEKKEIFQETLQLIHKEKFTAKSLSFPQ